MSLARWFVVLAVLSSGGAKGLVQAADWGDLSGTFVYDGQPSKPAKLMVNKDLECCGKYLDEIVDESVTVGPGNGLANVFVYLRTPMGKKIDIHPDLIKQASEPVVLDNIHCLFKPHAMTVWAGRQTLVITNSDPIGHAAKMDFLRNSPVNALLPAGGRMEQKFQNFETLPTMVSCGVHPWETAYLKVHDSPYAAVTDAQGRFKIEKIPAGECEFQVWQESCGFLAAKPEWPKGRVKVKIKAGANDLGVVKVAPALLKKK